MSQWRLYTIRLLVAVFLVLFVLLLSHVEAQRSDEILEWLPYEEESVPPHYCNDHENVCDFDTNVYDGHVLRRLHEYVDDEVLSVDVDVEEEQEEERLEELYREGYSLPHCPQQPADDEDERPAVVVSTLDGRITALDMVTGAVLWSHQTGDGGISPQLLSSSMSNLEVTSRGEWVRLIPSLDGAIFRFDGEGVEPLPVTADTLLHSSFKFNPDTIFTGAKVTEVWGLALGSGRVTYVCLPSGCKRPKTTSPAPTKMLVVRRVTQTVRAVDPKSGDERWNFSVGQHEVNLGGGGGCGTGGTKDKDSPLPPLPSLHFVVPDGVIMGMDQDDSLIWQQKLTSPVVNAWKVLKGELEEVDLFSTSSIPALSPDKGVQDTPGTKETGGKEKQPALYVGVHQQQLYIQQSSGMHDRFTNTLRMFTAESTEDSTGTKYPRVQWRPYLASAPSRTPIVNYNNRQHPLLLSFELQEEPNTAVALTHHIDYPFDNGYYLYADENLGQLNLSRPWNRPDPDEEEETLMDEVTSQIMHICFHIGPDTWFKLGVAVGCYALLHYLLLRYMVKYMRRQLTRQALVLVTQMFNLVLQNNPQILALMQRMGIQFQALPPPPPPPQPAQPQEGDEKALPAPAPQTQETPPSVERADSSSDYTSRYLTDFEVVQRLGRGGFGVVCQVRNKLDENEYAVKRINLPTNKSSAERVKREVRALAKLNHTNIVRYYNSWLETPPAGWQDPQDTLLNSGDVLSMSSLFSPGTEDSHNEVPGISTLDKRPEEGTSTSLSGIVGRLAVNGKVEMLTDTWGKDELLSGYEEEEEEEEEEDCSVQFTSGDECSKDGGWSKAKEQDSSFDIVFENSKSSSGLGKECTSEMKTETTESESGDYVVQEHEEMQGESPGKLSDSSQSIVFENSHTNSHSKDTNADCGKNGNTDTGSDEEPHITQPGVANKRRRVKSQPGQNNQNKKGERPRTLSLGSTTADGMKDGMKDKSAIKPSSILRTFLYIQMELCQKESLRDWLMQNTKRDKWEVVDMFNDITNAVEYVHDNHLMHRDLKPSNIFFSLEGKVKVGDFGLVTTIAEEEEQQAAYTPATCVENFPFKRTHTHRVGTRLYMSPEQLSGQVYDYKVDIYSLGLIFFEMLVPFGTGMERLTVMTRLRDEMQFPAKFEEDFPDESSLLKLMLSRDPACRPTTRGIRARQPLRSLQGRGVEDISPEDHFRLSRQRSQYPSSSSTTSLSTSSTTST